MEAECRHCGSTIHKVEMGWADGDGRLYCVNSPSSLSAHITHEPFPPGFRGEPRELAPA